MVEHTTPYRYTAALAGEILDDVLSSERCLRPQAARPAEWPASEVHAEENEWYVLVKAGVSREIFTLVRDE